MTGDAEQHSEEFAKWNAWDEFLETKITTGFMQSSWWADFEATNGWGHFGMVTKDVDTIVGGAVVFTYSFMDEKCYYYIPEGPVLPESESSAEQEQVFRTIMEFIDGKRQKESQVVSHLRIEPRWENVPSFVMGFQEAPSKYFYMPRNTLCIDLNHSENAILAQMKSNGRYNVRVAQKCGVSVIEDVSSQGIEDFLGIYEETSARKDLGEVSHNYFYRLIPMLSAIERGSVFFAEYQGIRLATALVVYFGRMATYFYGGSRATHRNVMAPYLLQFEIMRKAKALGCQCYDLFGVTPKSEPRNGWTDISVFKRKFGGQELRLVPTLDYIYDPIAYQEWRATEQK